MHAQCSIKVEWNHRCLFGPRPITQYGYPAFAKSPDRIKSAQLHEYKRYLSFSVGAKNNEMMYLPVEELHSRAKSLVAKLE